MVAAGDFAHSGRVRVEWRLCRAGICALFPLVQQCDQAECNARILHDNTVRCVILLYDKLVVLYARLLSVPACTVERWFKRLTITRPAPTSGWRA